jgi:hypothetical protein
MRGLILGVVLLAGCGGDDCGTSTACGAHSYRLCSGGASDCYYRTSDGNSYHCTTCGDCSAALGEVTSWCEGQPASTTGGAGGDIGSTCSGTSTPCPSGKGSFQACASPDGSACGIKTTDGTVFKCNSCSDCTAAGTQAAMWCEGDGTSSSGGTSSTGGMSSSGTTCDLLAQNCGAGRKCVGIWGASSDTTFCKASNVQPVREGDPCSNSGKDPIADDCAAGLVCADLDGFGDGTCRQLCVGDGDCPGGQRCLAAFGAGAKWGWCEPTCVPFTNSCADADCSSHGDDFVQASSGEDGFFMCRNLGSARLFDSCQTDSDCGPNLWCEVVGGQQAGVCLGLCSATTRCAQSATSGQTRCVALDSSGDAGYCTLN